MINIFSWLFKPVEISEPRPLLVDYSKDLETMIDDGCYSVISENISGRFFKIEGVGKVKVQSVLFHFDQEIYRKQAEAEIRKHEYEPARLEHQLTYGARYPQEQMLHPIVQIGSIAETSEGDIITHLDGSEELGRGLIYSWSDFVFKSHFRILAIRFVNVTF